MKESGNNSEITLCRSCKHGGAVVEACRCPDLSPDMWKYFEPTDERRAQCRAAQIIVKQKISENRLPGSFTLLPYVAVASAVSRGRCEYYAKIAQK